MDEVENLVQEILQGRKYRHLSLPAETVRDLLHRELCKNPNPKIAVKAVRKKLHNIVAPYLGDPDYSESARRLDIAFQSGDPAQVKETCRWIMAGHASTRERLAELETSYERIFAITGIPETILDLACGLNPLALPWMGLPAGTHYFAFDLNQPRVELLNHFFKLLGIQGLAFHADILLEPPQQEADAAIFFKEAHRFEQRQHGCNRAFWQALNVRWLLVSLPASSLSGKHDLAERQRALVYNTLSGLAWQVQEIQIQDELVFCIRKTI